MSKVNAKKLLTLLLSVTLLALPVMAAGQQDLIDPQQLTQQQISYKTTQVQTGSFIKELSTTGSAYYPMTYYASFAGSNAKFAEYTVAVGDTVKVGDVLARFSVETDDIAITRLERQLARAEEEVEAGILQRREVIAALKKEIAGLADGAEKEKKEITLQKLKTELERYEYTQQRSLDAQQQALDALYDQRENNVLLAPADGVITELVQKKAEETVSAGEALAVIVCEDVVLLRVGNPFGELRYHMPVQVTVGRANSQTVLTGTVVSADNVIAQSAQTGYAYVQLNLSASQNVNLDNPGIVAASMQLDNVLLVDRSAIHAENGRFYVNKLSNGVVQKRYILIGMQNAEYAWVMDGVTEGETLIVD